MKTKPTETEALRWVNALRSGKYEKCDTSLQDGNRYDCFGVACKLFIPKNEQILWNNELRGEFLGEYNQPFAPQWLKISDSYFRHRTGLSLSTLNDYKHCDDEGNSIYESLTFDEIADIIQLIYLEGGL